MSDNSKLKVVSNIEQRIDDVLNDLNKGMNVQDTAATEVLELFKPDATFYKEYFKNNPNSKYMFKHFSIPYAISGEDYVNYFCHTYLAIIPRGFETFLEGLDFHSFEDDGYYQNFVLENASEYYEHVSEKKNIQRFIENMATKGKILLLSHITYVHHVRSDGKTITRSIVSPVPCLGEFYQGVDGVYKFRVINPELEDEIMIIADDQIVLDDNEVKLNLERRKNKC